MSRRSVCVIRSELPRTGIPHGRTVAPQSGTLARETSSCRQTGELNGSTLAIASTGWTFTSLNRAFPWPSIAAGTFRPGARSTFRDALGAVRRTIRSEGGPHRRLPARVADGGTPVRIWEELPASCHRGKLAAPAGGIRRPKKCSEPGDRRIAGRKRGRGSNPHATAASNRDMGTRSEFFRDPPRKRWI